jgi:pimeloyl-ACP methyl ester carboxylesterase
MPDPTLTRVESKDSDAPVFDVIEAYWSPLDKGKTTYNSVASWMLRSIFVPLNTTARYAAPLLKTLYDFALAVGGIVAVVVLIAVALWAAFRSFNLLVVAAGTCAPNCDSVWDVIANPAQLASVFTVRTLGVLAMAAVGAFLLGQAIKAFVPMLSQRAARKRHEAQSANRNWLVLLVTIAGLALLIASALTPLKVGGTAGSLLPLGFVLSALCFVGGRTLAQSWVVNFFGDVQIYTTRDENSEFYDLREQILERVSDTIIAACRDDANGGKGYDRVFVLAHSLGSTIAMDALIRFSNACEQAPELDTAFSKVRAFVTFGSPLEKTRFFFNVADPSPSAAREQWDGDLYGALFTPDVADLSKPNDQRVGIVWVNYWYFADVIANAIDSFRSFVSPGTPLADAHVQRTQVADHARQTGEQLIGALVARNERGHKSLMFPDIIPHGEYLVDPWFWRSTADHVGALFIVANHCRRAPAQFHAFGGPAYGRLSTGGRYQAVDQKQVRYYGDCYPPKSDTSRQAPFWQRIAKLKGER